MRSKEMYELVDSIAPFSLSRAYCEAFGAYDNSGLLVDCGRDVKKALFSLAMLRSPRIITPSMTACPPILLLLFLIYLYFYSRAEYKRTSVLLRLYEK